MTQASEPDIGILSDIRDEVIRQGEQQQMRLHSIRQLAVQFTGIFLAGAVIALSASWDSKDGFTFKSNFFIVFALCFLFLGLASAIVAMSSRQWHAGPKIQPMLDESYVEKEAVAGFKNKLIRSYLINFKANENILRQQMKWLSFMAAAYMYSFVFYIRGLIDNTSDIAGY